MIPISGDLVLEGLGIQPEIRKVLTEEVNVILNSAASVNFDDPIREALQINYFGAMRILDLAKQCKNLIALHHVSTAFVNANMPNHSMCREEVLPWSGTEDWEEWLNKVVKMEPQVLEREEPSILKKFGFPNTYTLTKSLAEQAFKRYHGDIRLSISRPAVVTAT